MKDFLAGFFVLITEIVMSVPFWIVRRSFLRLFIKRLGKGCYIMRNVDIRKPKNIKLGKNVVINKNPC